MACDFFLVALRSFRGALAALSLRGAAAGFLLLLEAAAAAAAGFFDGVRSKGTAGLEGARREATGAAAGFFLSLGRSFIRRVGLSLSGFGRRSTQMGLRRGGCGFFADLAGARGFEAVAAGFLVGAMGWSTRLDLIRSAAACLCVC